MNSFSHITKTFSYRHRRDVNNSHNKNYNKNNFTTKNMQQCNKRNQSKHSVYTNNNHQYNNKYRRNNRIDLGVEVKRTTGKFRI